MGKIEVAELIHKLVQEIDGIWIERDPYASEVAFDLEVAYCDYKLVIDEEKMVVSLHNIWTDSSEGYREIGAQIESFNLHEDRELKRFKLYMEDL